jgi:hypothetical protein
MSYILESNLLEQHLQDLSCTEKDEISMVNSRSIISEVNYDKISKNLPRFCFGNTNVIS